MISVFDYKNQYKYLRDRLSYGSKKWGSKSKFSSALRIQSAFLSQVLSEKYSLSLEQADLANSYFEHSKNEAEYFILLVSRDRAGTPSLKEFYTQQINKKMTEYQLLTEALGKKQEIDEQTKGIYYSSWLYAAVHVGCTIANLRTKKQLSQKFNMDENKIEEILAFLTEHSMLEKKMNEYFPNQNWVRLGKDSPHIIKHHTNWRMQAVQNLERQKDNDLHFSGIYSMDLMTAKSIQTEIINFLKQQQKKIETAKEENLYILGLDFFEK